MFVWRLSDHPALIEFRCRHCDRYARYRRDKLIERYGDLVGPNLLPIMSAEASCERAGNLIHERCGLYYVNPPDWR